MFSLRKSIKAGLLPWVARFLDRASNAEMDQLLGAHAQRKKTPLFYPEYPFESKPRWTSSAPHPAILRALDAHNARYEKQLQAFNAYAEKLGRIPALASEQTAGPCWKNGWIPGLDAISIYGFLAGSKARRYFEIGSGQSTKFARRAIQDFGLTTQILSIDPCPRAEVASLCDRVLRSGLETVDLKIFDELEAGDVLFVDNSHRTQMNSDVTTFFLDVLPRLKKGVVVGVHDIYWPLDYPADWAGRYYSEQYLLAPLILWKPDFEVLLPAFHVSVCPRQQLMQTLEPIWKVLPPHVERYGGGFWFRW